MSQKEPAKGKEPVSEEEPDPRILLAILGLVAVLAIVGGLFLRPTGEEKNILPDRNITFTGKTDQEGQVRDGRYIGQLVTFRLPMGASEVLGSSDQYSEHVNWENQGGPGSVSAIPLLPGETLSDIAEAAGISDKETPVGGRPALFSISPVNDSWNVQIQMIVDDYKLIISNINRSRAAAKDGAIEIASTVAARRG